jgi:hypothetical protein
VLEKRMFATKFDNNLFAFAGTATERREAAEREQLRREAERRKFIVAQSSPQYEPQQRIQLWEHLHAMRLPPAADHRLVRVIAKQTALTVEQVQKEQVRRTTATNSVVVTESGT